MKCKHYGKTIIYRKGDAVWDEGWRHTEVPYLNCFYPKDTSKVAEPLDFEVYYKQIINIKTNLK